jgi:hypothetical protein
MRTAIAILVLCIVSTTVAKDEPPEILIVPRSVHLPSSGRAVFDVYWHNWASKPAVIPALNICYFSWWAIVSGQPSGERRASRVVVDHRAPARPIAPSAVVHDTITGKLQLKPGEIAQVSLRANRDDGKILESNIIVFTRR